jgi:hypothetical protein
VTPPRRLDRERIVRRHDPVFTAPHPADVLTVGNGDIAMTVDLSGLQTFPAFHELRPDPLRVPREHGDAGLPAQPVRPYSKDDYQIPLRTQSNWGWYRTRTDRGYLDDDATSLYPTARGLVPYLDRMGLQRPTDHIPPELEAGAWLHSNPRRLHLGRLALCGVGGFRAPSHPSELTDPRLHLDLWTGTVTAEYSLNGAPVRVTTAAHPESATFAVRVESSLVAEGLAVQWCFDEQPDDLAAFEHPVRCGTSWHTDDDACIAVRTVEQSEYTVAVRSSGCLEVDEPGQRAIATSEGDTLEVVVTLGDRSASPPTSATAGEVFTASRDWWDAYWRDGAAVSFAGSSSRAATELERRIVLSQYLTVVNCAGSMPPQETGLTYNSWAGKFHLEMHWWHSAHFALWGRGGLLERSLDWYARTLPSARAAAELQGYAGARWPKQTDPSGRESPSEIGVFIIWQQPHIIHLLELLRRSGRSDRELARHLPLIEATAEFMADFVVRTQDGHELPPPLVPAQESYFPDRSRTANPTFELAYWSWALRIADEWMSRHGRGRRLEWSEVAQGMRAPRMLEDGTYAAVTSPGYVVREDHPSMLMAFGWLPPVGLIDERTMSRTLDVVDARWDRQSLWGWDFPVMAMTAARLGDVGRAIGYLLCDGPKNHYLGNGHNPQRPGFLSIYLPANGGVLAAVAHIVHALQRGESAPEGWVIEFEGFAMKP